MSHTGRKTNLEGKYKENDFINEIEDNRHLLTTNNKVKSNRTRTEISNEISRYKYKLGRTKKPATKAKYELKIKELNLERDVFIDKRTTAKRSYLEFVFTLTDVKENLKRDLEYGRDLNDLMLEYFKDKFPNAKIVLSALHLDQSNPHIHISAMYPEEAGVSLTTDLNKSYGDIKFHYQTMQLDFNNYVRESELIKKYEIKLDEITKGGKRDYLKLTEYKALEARMRVRATNAVNKLLGSYEADNLNSKAIIDNLANKLKQYYLKAISHDEFSLKSNEIILSKDLELEKLKEVLSKMKVGAKQLIKANDAVVKQNEELNKDVIYLNDLIDKMERKAEVNDNTLNLKIDRAVRDLKRENNNLNNERIELLKQNHEMAERLEELEPDKTNKRRMR